MAKPTKIEQLAQVELAQRELAHRKLLNFTTYTKPNYETTPFHAAYIRILQAWNDFKIRKLIISVPPQHGKSEMSTRRLPAFISGQHPERNVAVMSYSDNRAWRFGREIKLIMAHEKYYNVFGKVLPDSSHEGYSNTAGVVDIPVEGSDDSGHHFYVGRGGGLTGEPVDDLLLDDLYKNAAEANSPLIRQSVIDMYDTVAESRLHNDSRQLLVFTRWDEDDLIGHIKSTCDYETLVCWDQLEGADPYKWYVINFEALKASAPTEIDPREMGEALYTSRHSKRKLEATRDRLTQEEPEKWEGMYQGDPTPKTGLLYSSGFNMYDTLPQMVERKAYIDVADQGKDFLCCIAYGVGVDNYIYPLDVYYTQESADMTELEVAKLLLRNRVDEAFFESNAGGLSYARNVQRMLREMKGTTTINAFHQGGNKESRCRTNAGTVMRLVLMPSNWMNIWPLFSKHIRAFKRLFKSNAFDDCSDCLTGVVEKSGLSEEDDFAVGSA
jgi:predicted phage terminase large subunit-like protein